VNELAGSKGLVPVGTSSEPTQGPGFPLDVAQPNHSGAATTMPAAAAPSPAVTP